MTKTIVKDGVVVEYEGQYWGNHYPYAASDEVPVMGWVNDIFSATVGDPNIYKKPTSFHNTSMEYSELSKGRLVPVKITTTYEWDTV